MIKSITVTNYLGESIKLELARPEKSGFVVKSVTGLGPGKADVSMTEVSTNDGGLYSSARLPSRNIVISLGFLWSHAYSIEELRHKSYKYFPIKKKVTLLIETDKRKAEIEGYVESNDPNIFSKSEGADISIVCPNPYFHSAGEDGGNITVFYGINPMFEFPFSNESTSENLIEFDTIENKSEQVIFYDGDSEVGVTITIHARGPATNITIYNTGSRELMKINTDKLASLMGYGLVSGDDIVICTVKGSKSIKLVRSGEATNILNCLDRNADWFQLVKGDNIFAYTAETGASNLEFRIEHRVVYEGV